MNIITQSRWIRQEKPCIIALRIEVVFVSTVTEVREMRGCMLISWDDAPMLRVRKVHFAHLPLEEGDDTDVEEYQNRIASIQFADAYEAALCSLDFCARAAKELERSLLSKGYVEPVVEAVLAKLIENRLIDDRRLASRIAETNTTKPVGLYAMKRKLRAKGISDEDASEALESFDEEQQRKAALAAAGKLIKRYSSLPEREKRAKLSQALARRGFPWDAVSAAVEALTGGDDYYE